MILVEITARQSKKQERVELTLSQNVYFDGSEKQFDEIIDKSITNKDLSRLIKRRRVHENSTKFLEVTLPNQRK